MMGGRSLLKYTLHHGFKAPSRSLERRLRKPVRSRKDTVCAAHCGMLETFRAGGNQGCGTRDVNLPGSANLLQ